MLMAGIAYIIWHIMWLVQSKFLIPYCSSVFSKSLVLPTLCSWHFLHFVPHHINVPSTGKWMQLERFVTEKLGESEILIHYSLQVFVVIRNKKEVQEKSGLSSVGQ